MISKSRKELLETLNKPEFEFEGGVIRNEWLRLKQKSIADFRRQPHKNKHLSDILLSLQVKRTAFGFFKQQTVTNACYTMDFSKSGTGYSRSATRDVRISADPSAKDPVRGSTSGTGKENELIAVKSVDKRPDKIVMSGTTSRLGFAATSEPPHRPFVKLGAVKKINLKNLKFLSKKLETIPVNDFSNQLSKYRNLAPLTPHFLPSKYFLPVSEHASLNLFETEEGPKLLVYGGLGNGINHDFVLFDLITQNFEALKVANDGNWARYGHSTTVSDAKKILVFGGDKHFRRIINPLENSNQTQVGQNFWSVDMGTGMAEELRAESLKKPKHRKFHGACLFDRNYLLIFGGMKINYKFMNDFWLFDIEETVWHEFPVDFDANPFLEEGIAHHSLTCMSAEIVELTKGESGGKMGGPNEKTQKAIYVFKNHKKNILLDVYLFGGINEANELMDNRLWRLGMRNHDFYFKEVPVKGRMPEKRHSHTLTACPRDRSLILIGGKSESGVFLRDLQIFRMPTGTWEPCVIADNPFDNGVAGHAAEALDNCIFIFGGITNEGFRVPGLTYFTCAKN